MKRRNYFAAGFIFISLLFFFSCSKTTGILYKIFTQAFKSFTPLESKSEKILDEITGAYILNNERGLLIEKKDEQTYAVKFLTTSLSEHNREMEGFISTLNNRTYLNLLAQDGNFIFVRLDMDADSVQMKLITHQVSRFLAGLELSAWLKKDGEIPDTSAALFKIPLTKKSVEVVTAWNKSQLLPQVRELESYYRFEKLFPEDKDLPDLKKFAVERTVNRTRSVPDLYKLIQKYPESEAKAKERARFICTSTKNCLDFISYFPEEGVRDSMLDNAFRYAKNENDFKTLMEKFPDHRKTPYAMTKLYYLEREKKSPAGDVNEILSRYKNNPAFIRQTETIRIFENLPFNEIQFNKNSYLLTQSSKNALDRFLLFISENNKERHCINDVYVVVTCNAVPAGVKESGMINFKQSLNRAVSLEKIILKNPPKGVNFHFIPCGTRLNPDSLSDGAVRFLLSDNVANEYKSRFLKLCLSYRKYFVVPDINREYVADTYIRELELENYICSLLKTKLTEDKNATLKVIPVNFWKDEYAKDYPELESTRNEILDCFSEKKLRRRKPADYVIDLK